MIRSIVSLGQFTHLAVWAIWRIFKHSAPVLKVGKNAQGTSFAHVYKTEGSLSQWLIASGVFAVLAFVLPLSGVERGLLLMGGVMILAVECMNTAIERVVDDIGTDQRDAAKYAKDCGSAAVAVGVAWVCVIAGLIGKVGTRGPFFANAPAYLM